MMEVFGANPMTGPPRAGRWIPSIMPRITAAVAMAAPVEPIVTAASAMPFLTSPVVTTIEALGF